MMAFEALDSITFAASYLVPQCIACSLRLLGLESAEFLIETSLSLSSDEGKRESLRMPCSCKAA